MPVYLLGVGFNPASFFMLYTMIVNSVDILHNIFEVNHIQSSLKTNIMLTINIKKEDFQIENLGIRHLSYILRTCPFSIEGEKHYFANYLKFKQDGYRTEISFLPNIIWEQKKFILRMLSILLKEYKLNLIGIKIELSVHDKLKCIYGEKHTEKILFREPADILNFGPPKNSIEMNIFPKRYETIAWIQDCENHYFEDEHALVKVILATRVISTLIIA